MTQRSRLSKSEWNQIVRCLRRCRWQWQVRENSCKHDNSSLMQQISFQRSKWLFIKLKKDPLNNKSSRFYLCFLCCTSCLQIDQVCLLEFLAGMWYSIYSEIQIFWSENVTHGSVSPICTGAASSGVYIRQPERLCSWEKSESRVWWEPFSVCLSCWKEHKKTEA